MLCVSFSCIVIHILLLSINTASLNGPVYTSVDTSWRKSQIYLLNRFHCCHVGPPSVHVPPVYNLSFSMTVNKIRSTSLDYGCTWVSDPEIYAHPP